MRVNVYAEELTKEVKVVDKLMEDGRTFFAVRLFLKSPQELHHTATDDDRSAITFWVPWTHEKGNDPDALVFVAQQILAGAMKVRDDILANQRK